MPVVVVYLLPDISELVLQTCLERVSRHSHTLVVETQVTQIEEVRDSLYLFVYRVFLFVYLLFEFFSFREVD